MPSSVASTRWRSYESRDPLTGEGASRRSSKECSTDPPNRDLEAQSRLSAHSLRYLDEVATAQTYAGSQLRNVMTDTEELLDIARERITRGFTDTECNTYHIDPCPTLKEIRQG
jgi:hypothetical protein